ncbi:B30.2/SPRY domain-containing protein [Entamoeba marina]
MNICLKFSSFKDIRRFVQVNKKCYESVVMLKVNPFFNYFSSIKKFCIHFKPTTINLANHQFFNSKLFSVVEYIKYPQFSSFIKNNRHDIRELIPKIKSFELFENDEQTQFFIKNAHLFNNIQKIKGDLFQIIKFMKNFSNNGTVKNILYPKVLQSEGINYSFSNSLIRSINELKSYIPLLNETKIYLQFLCHTENSNQQLLSQLTDVFHSYCYFSDNNSYLFKNNYSLYQDSILVLNEVSYPNIYNQLIEKTYGNICLVFRTEKMSKDSKTWIIPTCIKELVILCSNLEWNKKDSFINFNMNNLKQLTISESNYILFCNEFNLLTHLKIDKCNNILFNHQNIKVFEYDLPCIEYIEINNSTHIEIQLTNNTLKSICIDQSKYIIVKGNVDNVEQFIISYSKNCIIPSKLLEIENITIENSDINYSDMNLNESSKYKLLKLIKLFESYFCTLSNPQLQIDDLFHIRRFTSLRSNVEVNNNTYSNIDELPNKLKMISNEFYKKNNPTKQLIWSNGKQIEFLATIHYFEVEIIGYAIIQIGLFDRPINSFVIDELDRNKGTPYGPIFGKEYENEVIGCGFNTVTNEIFFVHNGLKFESNKVNWNNISAMISVDDFEEFTINYGQKPFVFNLEKAIRNINQNIKR